MADQKGWTKGDVFSRAGFSAGALAVGPPMMGTAVARNALPIPDPDDDASCYFRNRLAAAGDLQGIYFFQVCQ